MAAQVNGCILILYIVNIQRSTRKLAAAQPNGLCASLVSCATKWKMRKMACSQKPKMEMHFFPKILHAGRV